MDATITAAAVVALPRLRQLPIVPIGWERLHASPLNPRRRIDEAALAELGESIAAHGLQQNLTARPHPEIAGDCEIASGNRRWLAVVALVRAGRLAPDVELPCAVRDLTDDEMRLIGIAENSARADLTPFEEGDAIIDLANQPDQVIADAGGWTLARVHRRKQLALRAAPETRDAYERKLINLGQAEALCTGEKWKQAELLPRIIRDPATWDGPTIRRELAKGWIDLADAIFDTAYYPADKIERDLFGAWGTDREEFRRLQLAAAQARCAELKEQWAWAELQTGGRFFPAWDYERDIAPGAGGGAIVHLRDDLTVGFHTALRARPKQPAAPRAPHAAAAPPLAERRWPAAMEAPVGPPRARDDAAAPELAAAQLSRAHIVAVKQEKSRWLQRAIAEDTDIAEALAIIGLLGMSPPGEWLEVRLGARERGAHDDWFDHPELDALIDRRLPCPLAEASPAGMFARLIAMPAHPRRLLLAVLVAERFATWPGQEPALGDSELAIAVAHEADLDLAPPAGWALDAAFLERCSKPRLAAIAHAAGIGERVGDLTKPEIIDAILLDPGRNPAWRPPELRFAPTAAIAAQLVADARAAAPPAPAEAAE